MTGLNIMKIFEIFKGLKKKIFFFSFLSILISILDLVGIGTVIILVKTLFNFQEKSEILNFIDLSDFKILILGSMFLTISFIFKNFLTIFLQKKILIFCFDQQVILRNNIFKKYLFFPFEEILKKDFGEKVINIYQSVRTLTENYLSYLIRIYTDLFILFIILSYMFFFNFTFTLVITIFTALLYLVLKKLFQKKITSYGKNTFLATTDILNNSNNLTNAFKEIKVFLREEYFLNLMKKFSINFSKNQIKFLISTMLPKYITEILFIMILSFSICFVYYYEKDTNKIILTLSVFGFIAFRSAPLVNNILSSISNLWNSEYVVEKVLSDLNFDAVYNKELDIKKNCINFDQKIQLVNFSFNFNKKKIFNSANFEINQNSIQVIKGLSGSGKSTLINIIMGFLKIKDGKILVDGVEIDNKNYGLFGQAVYIPQETYISNTTILENILFGSEYDLEKFSYTLKKCNLDKFINNLDKKELTNVGELGKFISGGERQRISIARGLYNNKNIIILDEPTNNLDEVSKNNLIELLINLKKNSAILIITHDSIFDKIASEIFQIKDCQITKIYDQNLNPA